MLICPFKEVNIEDEFFNSFKENYPEWEEWWKNHQNDLVCLFKENDRIISFLKLKIEYSVCNYPYKKQENIEKVLKICSFKSIKYFDQTFIKYIFDYANAEKINVIYGTLFINEKTIKLYHLLLENGFNITNVHKNNEVVLTKILYGKDTK